MATNSKGIYYRANTDANATSEAQALAVADSIPVGPNYVVNGAMDIWQRGTSVAASAGGRVFSADRWNHWRGAVDTTTTYSQQASGLPITKYALRVARNSGSTSTADVITDYDFESQYITPLIGKTVTFSFYARAGANYSSASSVLNTKLISGTGTDQRAYDGVAGAVNVVSATTTLTTSWQRFSYTGTVASSATQLFIQLNYTPTGTAGANDYFEVTGVQLEEGSSATTFRRNSNNLQAELAACQRYYIRFTPTIYSAIGTGTVDSLGHISVYIPFPVMMRIPPTSMEYSGMYGTDRISADYPLSTFNETRYSTNGAYFNITLTSNLSAYRVAFIIGHISNSNAYMGFTSEL